MQTWIMFLTSKIISKTHFNLFDFRDFSEHTINMIKFKTDTELNVITDFNEETDNIEGDKMEIFKAGEPVDVEITSEDGDHVGLQFGDGSVALGVLRSSFDEV